MVIDMKIFLLIFGFLSMVISGISLADRPKPDIHCILKSNRILPEGRECVYRCADKARLQYIQKEKHRCPTRIFKKNKG